MSDWSIKSLADICEKIFAGGDVPKERLSKYKTERYKVPIYANGEKNKGLYGYTDIARVTMPSITVSARGTIGYSEIRYKPFLPIVRLIVLTPNTAIVQLEYLKYVLAGMNFINSGSSIPQLTVPMIRGYQCEIPPLEEQKRIVTILDRTFTEIEKARATAEKNLENARELFESKKAQIFAKLAIHSQNISISDTCSEIFAGGDVPKKSLSKEKTEKFKIPIIANAVKNRGLYGYTENARVKQPSVTVAARGSGTGHTEVRKEPFLPIVRLIVLTPKSEMVDVDYLFYAIKNLDILRSGSAIPQLTIPMIKGYSIPLPNMKMQLEAVEEIDVANSAVDKLVNNYKEKIERLDELKQSILQKAFTGELTKNKGIAA